MQGKIAKEIYKGIIGVPRLSDNSVNKYIRKKCMNHAAAIFKYKTKRYAEDGHWLDEEKKAKLEQQIGELEVENIEQSEFISFYKIPRLSKDCIISEKLDGTNGQIFIGENGEFLVGSRTRWITPKNDNFGFAKWAYEHKEELMELGKGRHFGEWWGSGIQRGYGLPKGEKRFSLFNTIRWCMYPEQPFCCNVVPILYRGLFTSQAVEDCLAYLQLKGSQAAPGFMKPEGVVVYHIAGNVSFKKTIENDEEHKGNSR